MCLTAGGALAVASGPSAAAPSSLGQATQVTAPANAGVNPSAAFHGVSCPSAGTCVGVGDYIDSSGDGQAMAASATGGTFAQATEVRAPSNAGDNPEATLRGVSCTSAGNCVAVGDYTAGSGFRGEAMEATETGGTFAQATQVILPSNASITPNTFFRDVSCTLAGNCVAVGDYNDASGHRRAMEATATGGTFAQATEVTAPSNTRESVFAELYGVSCTSAGNCLAVGNYIDSSGHRQAMEATATNGTFAQATEITAPSNAGEDPEAFLEGVSCPSAGNCVAAGWYHDSSERTQEMATTMTGGTFAQATEVSAPANAGDNPFAQFFGVSCASAGNCVAIGRYGDRSGHLQAMEATATGGTFAQATEVTAPSNVADDVIAGFLGVSCSTANSCVAVGLYVDSSEHGQAMATTPTLPPLPAHLYWANGGSGTIMAANADGSDVTTLVSGQRQPTGVAVDASHVYWNNESGNTIMRANLDGTGLTTLVSRQATPSKVALDATHIYWTNEGAGTVMRANLDGTGVTTLVSGQGKAEGVAVDATHIYWSNETTPGTIKRANLDGSEVTTLESGQTRPEGVTVDATHLYWANETRAGTVMEANLDGTGPRTIATDPGTSQGPTGVAVDATHLYWSDRGLGTITEANLDGTGATVIVRGQNAPEGVALSTEEVLPGACVVTDTNTNTTYGSLEAAVNAANSGADLTVSGTCTSINTFIDKNLTITGVGSSPTLNGEGEGHVLVIHNPSGMVTINGMDITRGSAEFGGGIEALGGSLTLNFDNLFGNIADIGGGGVLDFGALNLNGGSITDNTALFGGGVIDFGTLTGDRGIVTDNSAPIGPNIFVSP